MKTVINNPPAGAVTDTGEPSPAAKRHAEIRRQQYPDHRWRTACELFNSGIDEFSPDLDPWVIGTIVVLRDIERQVEEPPTEIHWAVFQAQKVYHSDTLRRQIIEARLVSDMDLEEIAERSQLSELEIETYHALFFDVRSPGGRNRWMHGPYEPGPTPMLGPVEAFGRALKVIANNNGPEALEQAVDTLLEVEGSTMAAGITLADAVRETSMFKARFEVASRMPPHTRSMAMAIHGCIGSLAEVLESRPTKADIAQIKWDVLKAAGLPPHLQGECKRMRQERQSVAPKCRKTSAARRV